MCVCVCVMAVSCQESYIEAERDLSVCLYCSIQSWQLQFRREKWKSPGKKPWARCWTTPDISKSKGPIRNIFPPWASQGIDPHTDVWYVSVGLKIKEWEQFRNHPHLDFGGTGETTNNMAVDERICLRSLHSWAMYSKTVSPICMKVTLNERGRKCLHSDV